MKLLQTASMMGAAFGIAAGALPVPTSAQVDYGAGQQGSVLYFPYLTNDKERTHIRITNGGPDTVSVHFIRVCGGEPNILGTGDCNPLNKSMELTPNETANLAVALEFGTKVASNCTEGYVVAYVDGIGPNSGDLILDVYNHLYGEVSIEAFQGGNRMGGAPAIAIEALDDTNAEASKLLFDGNELELVGTKLKSTHRSTVTFLPSRGTKIFLGTFGRDVSNIPSTLVKFVAYNENEEFESGEVSYVCAGWFDPNEVGKEIPQLTLDGPGGLGTPFGSVKWTSTQQNNPVGGGFFPLQGIFGYWMREEGGGKRTLEPMWIDDEDATVATSFIN